MTLSRYFTVSRALFFVGGLAVSFMAVSSQVRGQCCPSQVGKGVTGFANLEMSSLGNGTGMLGSYELPTDKSPLEVTLYTNSDGQAVFNLTVDEQAFCTAGTSIISMKFETCGKTVTESILGIEVPSECYALDMQGLCPYSECPVLSCFWTAVSCVPDTPVKSGLLQIVEHEHEMFDPGNLQSPGTHPGENAPVTSVSGVISQALSLGRNPAGLPLGRLVWRVPADTADVSATLVELDPATAGAGVLAELTVGGVRQIISGAVLVNISPVDPGDTTAGFVVSAYSSTATTFASGGTALLSTAGLAPLSQATIEKTSAQVGSATLNGVQITSSRPGQAPETTALFSEPAVGGGGMAMEVQGATATRTYRLPFVGDERVETVEELQREGAADPFYVVGVREDTFEKFTWGERLVQRVEGTGPSARTSKWSYYTADGPARGKVHVQIDGQGGWSRSFYDANGKLQATYRPWLDGGSGLPAQPSLAQVEAVSPADCVVDEYQTSSFPVESQIHLTKVKGQLQSRVVTTERWVVDPVSGLNVKERQSEVFGGDGQRLGDSRSASENVLVGTMIQSGRAVYSIAADGTRVSYEETEATVNGELVQTSKTIHGTIARPMGDTLRSLRQLTISGPEGLRAQQTRIATGGGQDALLTTQSYERTQSGLVVTSVVKQDGVIVSTTTTETDGTVVSFDESGIETHTFADESTGVQTYTRKGLLIEHSGQTLHNGSDLVTVSFSEPRAAVGGVVPPGHREVRQRTANGVSLTELVVEYDELGQTVSSTDIQGRVTTFQYETTSQGGRRETETGPGGVTRISTYHRDGRLQSITGTGVVPEYHTYNVTGGHAVTTVHYGTANSPRWRRTTTDGQGRVVKEERPSFGGGGIWATVVHYNAKGQRVKVERPGLAPQLYEYDDLGQLFREGVDLNLNGVLDLNSVEPVTEYFSGYETEGDQWWQVSRVRRYTHEAAGPGQFMQRETRRRLGVGPLEVVVSRSGSGGQVTTTTTINRTQRRRTVTTAVSGNSNVGEQVSINGLNVFSKGPGDPVTTVMAYDSFERPVDVKGPQADLAYTYDAVGRLESETRRGAGSSLVTSYTYSPAHVASAGQVATMTAPVSRMKPAVTAVTYYGYDALGRLTEQWGGGDYPVHHVYDAYGDYVEMWTSRTALGDDSKPWEDAGNAALLSKTYWVYDASTGLQAQKKDHAQEATSHTYHAFGQVHTRTWAREVAGQPLRTEYEYDGAGRLTGVDYSDSTPDVSYAYYRHGALRQMTDAAGVHAYDVLSAQGRPLREVVTEGGSSAGYLAGLWLQRTEDEHGREAGLQGALTPVVTGARPLTLPAVGYAYGNRGQLSQVSSGGRSVGYSRAYTAGQAVLTMTRNGGSGAFTSTLKTDPALGPVETVHGTSPLLQKRTLNGLKIDHYDNYTGGYHLRPDSHWTYTMDDRGQVTGARKRIVTNTTSGATLLLGGWETAYAYDDIGNRVSARFGGDGGESSPVGSEAVEYQVNALNQYTQIDNPRVFFVTGSAPASGTMGITFNGVAAQRSTPFFWARQEVVGTGPGWADATLAVTSSGTPVLTVPKHVYAAPAQETLVYDEDGNLVEDGRWVYVWDGENRLREMTTRAAAVTGGVPEERLTFAYDGHSRRIRKVVEAKVGGVWELRSDTRFVYDGWNLLAEVEYLGTAPDAPPGTVAVPRPFLRRTFLWGPDLSGSLRGAGGVGGLLAITRHEHGPVPAKDYWATQDLNGNVIGLVTGGNLIALYDYDPFGKPLRVSEPEEDLNPFRFSTKYTDVETGLCYYGHRYYDAARGRWLNRDPIEEGGGVNLYGMVGNDSLNHIDKLGMLRISAREFPEECGAYSVTFLFQLSQPAVNHGYLVQEINKTVEIADCATGKTTTETTHFWESWPIGRGEQLPRGRGNHGNDTSGRGSQGCTRGKVVSRGTLKFVLFSDTGILGAPNVQIPYNLPPFPYDPSWGPGNQSTFPYTNIPSPSRPGHPDSGDLPSTRQEPSWWNNPSSDNGWRKVIAEWNCCGPTQAGSDARKTKLTVTKS